MPAAGGSSAPASVGSLRLLPSYLKCEGAQRARRNSGGRPPHWLSSGALMFSLTPATTWDVGGQQNVKRTQKEGIGNGLIGWKGNWRTQLDVLLRFDAVLPKRSTDSKLDQSGLVASRGSQPIWCPPRLPNLVAAIERGDWVAKVSSRSLASQAKLSPLYNRSVEFSNLSRVGVRVAAAFGVVVPVARGRSDCVSSVTMASLASAREAFEKGDYHHCLSLLDELKASTADIAEQASNTTVQHTVGATEGLRGLALLRLGEADTAVATFEAVLAVR
eukprot:scaffold481_cov238-Pinguiococcus_pyrenoidosus.AAC.5